jgi:hypothetical protein
MSDPRGFKFLAVAFTCYIAAVAFILWVLIHIGYPALAEWMRNTR